MNHKRYASIHNPTIQAVVSEMYRFATAEEAQWQIAAIRNNFVIAKKQLSNDTHPSLILWIKGYALVEADKKHGVIGHYALLAHKKIGERYTITATKLDWDYKLHPQRGLVQRDNPNWGHPVLRSAVKKKIYPTMEEAQAELNLLHETFPKVSIPNPGKLYIMIYCSSRPAKERMVKHMLTLRFDEEKQGYFIECKENPKDVRPKKRKPPTIAKNDAAKPKGTFTAKVALSRQRRKPRATPSQKSEED